MIDLIEHLNNEIDKNKKQLSLLEDKLKRWKNRKYPPSKNDFKKKQIQMNEAIENIMSYTYALSLIENNLEIKNKAQDWANKYCGYHQPNFDIIKYLFILIYESK